MSPNNNDLVCFTNCLLPLEDGSLIRKDLWVDAHRGIILDSQKTFYARGERPSKLVDLGGNILSPGFIDTQINGAYGFDFSVFDTEDVYRAGLRTVAERIVETGVTSLVPTIITQEKSLYRQILSLLRPLRNPSSATLLGWHTEGPFIDFAKRGAHSPPFLLSAPNGFRSFEDVYGTENLCDSEDWLMSDSNIGVRIITAAPEVQGVMEAMETLTKRGVIMSIGHSVADSVTATRAVQNGARLITHLFNAMPQLHHRDPSIIGLLGASPHVVSKAEEETAFLLPPPASLPDVSEQKAKETSQTAGQMSPRSEAFDPPDAQTPVLAATNDIPLSKSPTARKPFQKPFYELIVDGVHSHPNSVRLAYTAYPEGCILITDAMKVLDPHLKDGIHEWRDGQRFVKEGDKLYLEGTDTLAGSVVTLDKCVRNFVKFTGCSLGEAIRCATYNPAKCLNIQHIKGTLRPGADADLVVLDQNGEVLSTYVAGRIVWTAGGAKDD